MQLQLTNLMKTLYSPMTLFMTPILISVFYLIFAALFPHTIGLPTFSDFFLGYAIAVSLSVTHMIDPNAFKLNQLYKGIENFAYNMSITDGRRLFALAVKVFSLSIVFFLGVFVLLAVLDLEAARTMLASASQESFNSLFALCSLAGAWSAVLSHGLTKK